MNAQGGLSDSIQLWAQYDLVLDGTKLEKKVEYVLAVVDEEDSGPDRTHTLFSK